MLRGATVLRAADLILESARGEEPQPILHDRSAEGVLVGRHDLVDLGRRLAARRESPVDRVVLDGVSVRQLSLFSVSRNEPLNRLPPDLVMTLTTPPLNRPYSAEMPAVATVVS